MNITEKIQTIYYNLKTYCSDKSLHEDVSYLAFLVSLLPIPGVQQSAQVVDRIMSSKTLKKDFDELWDLINHTNKTISAITDDLEKLKETALTIQHNSELNSHLENLLNSIVAKFHENTEWIMETENWSYQELLNSTVEADFAAVISRNQSTNVVEQTEIKAEKTHLHASDGSKNFFDNTRFIGQKGSVAMQGITTKGDIIVQDSGVGFHAGGALIFGGNPNIVRGNCPLCGTKVQADKRELIKYQYVQCPGCKRNLPFNID